MTLHHQARRVSSPGHLAQPTLLEGAVVRGGALVVVGEAFEDGVGAAAAPVALAAPETRPTLPVLALTATAHGPGSLLADHATDRLAVSVRTV